MQACSVSNYGLAHCKGMECGGVMLSRGRVILDCVIFFFFNDTATTEIYTLSLHDALPI